MIFCIISRDFSCTIFLVLFVATFFTVPGFSWWRFDLKFFVYSSLVCIYTSKGCKNQNQNMEYWLLFFDTLLFYDMKTICFKRYVSLYVREYYCIWFLNIKNQEWKGDKPSMSIDLSEKWIAKQLWIRFRSYFTVYKEIKRKLYEIVLIPSKWINIGQFFFYITIINFQGIE